MKIIILHGDDTLKIHDRVKKFVVTAKNRGWDIYKIDDKSQDLLQVLSATGLFEKDKLIVVEDPKLLDSKIAKFIINKKNDLSGNLVIVNVGYLSKTFLKTLPKTDKIEEYKLPKAIWNFLDSFFPGNAKNTLLLLNKVVVGEPVEFVFSLLGKLFRDLYWVMKDARSLGYPSWRISKLQNQASKFKNSKLTEMIGDLAEIDVKAKTGQSDLKSLLDLLIVTRLE